jgi:hypothetical protein
MINGLSIDCHWSQGFALVMCYSISGLSDLLRCIAGLLHVDLGPIARQQHCTDFIGAIDALDGVFQDPIRVPTVGTRKEISNAYTFLFHSLASRHRFDHSSRNNREHCSAYNDGRCNHASPSDHQGKPGARGDRCCGSIQPFTSKIIPSHRLPGRSGASCNGDDHGRWHPLHPSSLDSQGGSSPATPLAGCPLS